MQDAESGGVSTESMLPSGAIHSTAHGTPPSCTLVLASKKGPAAKSAMPLPAPPPTSVRSVEPKSCSCGDDDDGNVELAQMDGCCTTDAACSALI